MFIDNFRRGESQTDSKTGSKAISKLADLGWKVFQAVNTALPEGKSIHPKWAPAPLLKSYERTRPPLGFPRETDSLCPKCVKIVREGVIKGDIPLEVLMYSHPGEIKAQLVEENGKIYIRKTCPTHGFFEDVLATDAAFLKRIESLFFGRDFRTADDAHVHHHGTSDIKFGRGAVLTV
ncbi:MAG: radical SAM protein, partial [Pyrinomonadaceae bacterium]